MQIRTSIIPSNGRFDVQIALDDTTLAISGRESDALRQFGHPLVDFGGHFKDLSYSFDIPVDVRRVPLQLPVKQSFYVTDYQHNTPGIADLYAKTIEQRIQDALAELLGQDAGDIGSRVQNLKPSADPHPVTGDTELGTWMDL